MTLVRDKRDEYRLAETVAKILGPSSAAQKALDLQNKYIAQGLYSPIMRAGESWIVPNMRERFEP